MLGIKGPNARMVGFPGAGGTSGTTKKAIGHLLCEVIVYGLLK